MIDIHSHILPFVDDGSDDLEKSIELLKVAVSQGVDKVICTPHYKSGVYEYSPSEIENEFNKFCSLVKERDIKVELFLGEEILCNDKIYDLIKQEKVLTVNKTKYILIEFNCFNYIDILDYAYNIKIMGYIPVIAHVERYSYLNLQDLIELKNLGALIQVNSSSVVGIDGKEFRKKAFAAIKIGLVDFISSDMHVNRNFNFEKAYKIIKRKFGKETAQKLFEENAKIFMTDC